MVKSYLLSAWRTLLKHKVPSLINILGLSVALACCIVVYLFLQVYYTLDTFHEHGDRIVMVEHQVERDGQVQTWGTAPMPLGPVMVEQFPSVERAVRVQWAGGDVRTADASFEERIGFADPDFFEVFSFPLQAGTTDALTTPGSVILSADAAQRYFGDADAVGQPLTVSYGERGPQTVLVQGVAAPFPRNNSLLFSVLLPFDARPLDTATSDPDGWGAFADATFLQLRSPSDMDGLAARMGTFLDQQHAANEAWPIQTFRLERLTEPAPDGHTVFRRPTEAPHPAFSLIMIGLAAFMVALSCFNYINIALGSAARRLKEIGVRKVVGGSQRQLIGQFMAENLLLCAIAMVLGIVLAWAFLVPLFNQLFVLNVALTFFEDLGLWAFLVGLLLFIGVASGAYPAFYISSFRPAVIFRGKAQLAEKRWLTRSLMTGQFAIAFLAVIVSVLLVMNGRYMLGQAWGYEPEGTVVVRLTDAEQFGPLRDAALQTASVRSVAGTQEHIGSSRNRLSYLIGDVEHEAFAYRVGPDYTETLGLPLRAGRSFSADRASDRTESVLVNQRFVEEHGWTNAIGQTLRLDGQAYTVVGVLGDVFDNPVVKVQPTFYRLADPSRYRFLTASVAPGREEEALAVLETAWQEHAPGQPFDAFAQSEVFDAQYASWNNLARGFSYLAALALLIACMGLFGLASQNIARRMKEVSVRKVLGATVPHLVYLVNRIFLVILALSALVATVISYSGLRVAMSFDMANLMPITPLPFLVAYVLVLMTVTVSVASQSRALVTANPADVLRGD